MLLKLKSLSKEDSKAIVSLALKESIRQWRLAEENKAAAARKAAAKIAAAKATADRKQRQADAAKKADEIRQKWVKEAQEREWQRLVDTLEVVGAANNTGDEKAVKAAYITVVNAQKLAATNKDLPAICFEQFVKTYNELLEQFSFDSDKAVGDEIAVNPATYQDYKKVLQRKDTFTMENFVMVWYTKNGGCHSIVDEAMIKAAKPVDRANNILRRKIDAPKNWYYKAFTGDFSSLIKGSLWYNTNKGLMNKPVDDLCDNIIQIDAGAAGEFRENSKAFYTRLLTGGVIIRIKFMDEKPEGWLENGQPDYLYYYDVEQDIFARLDSEIVTGKKDVRGLRGDIADDTKNRNNGMILTSEEIGYLVDSDEAIVKIYRPANRSTSSSRQQKGLWILELDEDNEKHYHKFQQLLNQATCGGFVRQLKKLTNKAISRCKAVKLLERDILELTDAHVYEHEGKIHSFAIYNSAWRWTDPTTGLPVEAYDGHFTLNKRVIKGVYKEAFGSEMFNEDEILGRLVQCRCGYIKGEADFVDNLGMKVMIDNLLSGKCSAGVVPVVYLLKGKKAFDSFDFNAKENEEALIFTGESFDDIEPDTSDGKVCDIEKIHRLAEEVDLYTDRNALKDIFDLYKAQHLSLMAFPPDDNKYVKLSNQILFSLLLHAGYYDENGELVKGKEIVFQLFKEMVERKLSDLVTPKDSFSIKDFANINVFADDAVKAIWPTTYWRDPYMHANGFSQLCRSLSKTIDHFGIEVKGFNAVGNVDPGLIVAGTNLIKPNEMFSGRVKNGKVKTAAFRHPKSGESALSLLWDISLSTIATRLTALQANGEITEDQFKVLFNKFKNLGERQAIVPTFCVAFTNRHDGSDSDGDSYTFVTQWQIVKALGNVLQAAVDYGHGSDDGKKVVFNWCTFENGTINFDKAYIELLENENHEAGDVVNFLGRMISIISAIESGGMTDFDITTLIAMFKSVSKKDEYAAFNNSQKNPYIRQFFACVSNDSPESERTIEITGKTVEDWKKYCNTHAIFNAATLLSWAYDMTYILASVIGRTLDSPKTGENVPVPFYDIKMLTFSAFGKGRKFQTSVSLEYVPTEIDDEGVVTEEEDFDYGYLVPGFYDQEGNLIDMEQEDHENPAYYIINDVALELKNQCLEYLVGDNGILYDFQLTVADNVAAHPMLDDINEYIEWGKANGLGAFSSALDFGRMNSSLSYYRPEEMKTMKTYTTGSLRSMSNIANRTWVDVLGMAYVASYRGWRQPVYEDEVISEEAGGAEEPARRVRSEYTRYYTAFGPELCRMAIEERRIEEPDFYPVIKEKLVATDSSYIFETGKILAFEKGIAKDGNSYILCGDIDGAFEVICEDGIPYIKEDVENYLERLSDDDNSHFAVELRQAAGGYSKKEMINEIINFMAQPEYNDYDIVTVSNNQSYNWIFAVNKEDKHDIIMFGSLTVADWRVNGYGDLEVDRNMTGHPFNADPEEDIQNAQRACLNYKVWNIKTALYSESSTGYQSAILALDYVGDADDLTYYYDSDFGYEMEGGFKSYKRFEDLM